MIIPIQGAERFKPARQLIVNTQLSQWLRRETGDEDVFTYFHLVEETWTICLWVNKLDGLFLPIMLLRNLNDLSREDAQFILAKLKGTADVVSNEQMKSNFVADARARYRQDEDDRENRRYLRDRAMCDVAHVRSRTQIPVGIEFGE